MYERSAIILDKYFENLFGYTQKNNLKENYKDYAKLVECSEKYTIATESEDKIMKEYDEVADKIKKIQKNQEILSKKSAEIQDERYDVFQNIAEEYEKIKKRFEKIDNDTEENNKKIKQIEQEFINVISDFSKKSEERNNLGKERKIVEQEYSKALNTALETYKNIDKENLKVARDFEQRDFNQIEKELYEKMKANGLKEKVAFDSNVMKNAIDLAINIRKKEIQILYSIYEKTTRLFSEIKNNSVKIERHKKQIKDAKSKLDFLNALKEYLIQYLDNERLSAVNGEQEHKKMMKEACKNFESDLVQINNMYELLLREIAGKATKKMYKELYDVEYLNKLKQNSIEFEKQISKLNLMGTVIDPNHWRNEGMEKIYNVFYNDVVDVYGRNLSEFKIDETNKEDKIINQEDGEKINNQKDEKSKENKVEHIDDKKEKITDVDDEEDEFDEKIDMILGFGKEDKDEDTKEINADEDDYDIDLSDLDDDDWDDEDDESTDWDDEEYEDDDEWNEKEIHKNNKEDELVEDDFWNDEDIRSEENEKDPSYDFDDDYELEDKEDLKNKVDKAKKQNMNQIIGYKNGDNPWDDEKNQNSKSTKKVTKGKHGNGEEKSKGLLGKFLK